MGMITANEAARETRKRIRAKIKRMYKERWNNHIDLLNHLVEFIDTMDDRQNAKKGGLGVKVAKSKG